MPPPSTVLLGDLWRSDNYVPPTPRLTLRVLGFTPSGLVQCERRFMGRRKRTTVARWRFGRGLSLVRRAGEA